MFVNSSFLFYLQHTKQPSSASEDNDQDSDEEAGPVKHPIISTNFAEWCASYFAQSVMKVISASGDQKTLKKYSHL